ncbi:hypothetical protein KIN20_002466 [Parelaphostrongylus tenuis]|uniref:Uncharacterized protein n=1 Tax=Parelaphostrongylus tenuis TaxID=148309 RepID=A0AAD5MNM3_PARTN|nr:hypothetical protein KIN20_002466 [Parelaphostrongylus tenuis]
MRAFIVLFVPVVIGKPDIPLVHAPGTYPVEEMNNEIPTMPMNPYQRTMIDTPENFYNYQFYYEKNVLPPARPRSDHDFINAHSKREPTPSSVTRRLLGGGPTPPPDTRPLQVVDINRLDGPIDNDDEQQTDDERVQRSQKLNPDSPEILEKSDSEPSGKIHSFNENVSDFNTQKKASYAETKPQSTWSPPKSIVNESDLMQDTRECCPCCRSPTYVTLNGKTPSYSSMDTKSGLSSESRTYNKGRHQFI